jgi:hypothetical protein
MAIISIPTSIGGVNIPGSLINGPLGALYSNVFQTDTLQYPRDLQSMTRGHVVHFTVRETQPVNFQELGTNILSNFTSGEGSLTDQVKGFLSSLGQSAATVTDALTNNLITQTGLNFQPKREKIVGNIFLYMPETINFQYNSQYTDTSVLEMGKNVIQGLGTGRGKVGGKLGAGLSAINTGTNAIAAFGQAGLQKLGYAVNPQMQLLFEGIGFRDYQMVFNFTPYSSQETEQVRKIIKMFRENAAPRIVTEAGGMFFVPPASFTLDFMFNGSTNPYITKTAESVITSVDVNYSPNGFSAHDDGAPVQIQMTLQFKEIELIDKAKIQQGF